MPNDCWNHLTITSHNDPSELNTLIHNEFMVLQDNKYTYSDHVNSIKRGPRGIYITVWSRWNPDFIWLEGLIAKYPSCWIKNEWDEEGGSAGVWIGCIKDNIPTIKQLEWDDICLEGKYAYFTEDAPACV